MPKAMVSDQPTATGKTSENHENSCVFHTVPDSPTPIPRKLRMNEPTISPRAADLVVGSGGRTSSSSRAAAPGGASVVTSVIYDLLSSLVRVLTTGGRRTQKPPGANSSSTHSS